jgi:hypothetical protein
MRSAGWPGLGRDPAYQGTKSIMRNRGGMRRARKRSWRPDGAGSEFQDFQNTSRAARDYIFGEGRASARLSLPFRNGSCSAGGQGTRRDDSAGALSSPGILARNRPGSRPVFGKAPERAPEKVRTERAVLRKARSLLPFLEGRTDIIGTGFGIVSGFRPDFL